MLGVIMKIFVFLLACYGLTNIVTGGKIFAGLRAWLLSKNVSAGFWIQCPMCFGLPVGVFWALAGLWPRMTWWPMDLLAAGCVGSGWCWAVHVVMVKMGEDEL